MKRLSAVTCLLFAIIFMTACGSTETANEREEKICAMYMSVLEELYADSPGLNQPEDESAGLTFGFDFSEVCNIGEESKRRLGEEFSKKHGAQAVFGTYAELCEQGLIDGERLYWENGLLFGITDSEINGRGFKFKCQKWRSGLGAIFFADCTAKESTGEWQYTLDGFAIS